MKQRLNKQMVRLGLADSRREADTQISAGLVKVNGEVAVVGMLVDDSARIENGTKLKSHKNDITLIYNKPKGRVCSHTKQGNAETIFYDLPKSFAKLKFAGRLDKDSEGLMILSSNGELVQKLSHPSGGKLKQYKVQIKPELSETDIARLLAGVKLEDGISKFVKLKKSSENYLFVTLSEGKNRQIRRSFEALGYSVVSLQKISQGKLELGRLKPAEYRFLTKTEIETL